MIKSAVITIIKNRLGQRTDLDDFITTELDLQQETALERNGRIVPWFMESEVASTTMEVGEQRVPIPADFAMAKEEGGLFVYRADQEEPWIPLTKVDYDDAVMKYGDQTGQPEVYSMGGDYYRMFPIPDQEYVLKQIYFQTDTPPSAVAAGSYNKWLRYAPDLVIAQMCVYLASFYMQDFDLAKVHQTALQAAWDRLHVETESQKHTGRQYQMGR